MLPQQKFLHSRRQFLLGSSVLSFAALLPHRLTAQAGPSQPLDQENSLFTVTPKDTLLKFNPDGSPKPFAGNTVICHLPPQSPIRDTVEAVGEALRSSSFAKKLGILPNDSYHITILGGPNNQDRALYGWPSDIPADAPISECNRIIGERVAQFRMHEELPIRFRVNAEKTLAFQRASGIQVEPTDLSEKAKLRTLQNRMATEIFRYRAEGHDTFGFHISLAYQLRPFSTQERQSYSALMERHVRAIIAASPVIELGVPEFCTFEDMFRFEVRTLLRT